MKTRKNKPMKTSTLMIFLFLLTFCHSEKPSRVYTSPVEATGGFFNFSLNLKPDGNLDLTIEISVQVKQSQSGEIWESHNESVKGIWILKNKSIQCSFNKSKSSIDSIFYNTEFGNLDKPLLSFSQKLDTAFIYGIPCILGKLK